MRAPHQSGPRDIVTVSSMATLFRRYRVELGPRLAGRLVEGTCIELLARTRGAARRTALQQNPGHVVRAVTLLD